MTTPDTTDEIRALWRSLPTEPVTITVDQMRARVRTFERRVRRRNMTEYVACAFLVVIFGWYATWPEPATPLWPIANLLIIAAAIHVSWKLHRHGGAAKASADASVTDLVAFHRAELARQRDGLLTVWRWYALPFLPGTALWFVAIWIGRPTEHSPVFAAIVLGLVIAIVLAVVGGLILLNLIGAAYLQRQIDDLSRYTDMDQFTDSDRIGDFGRKEKKQ